MSTPIRVLIADDQALVRGALATLLGLEPDIDVVAQTGSEQVDPAQAGRLHILEVQRLIRHMPKVVIAAIPGWAAGGGHSLNVVCDLSVASLEHAAFMQT